MRLDEPVAIRGMLTKLARFIFLKFVGNGGWLREGACICEVCKECD